MLVLKAYPPPGCRQSQLYIAAIYCHCMRTLRQAVVRVSLVRFRALGVLGAGTKHTQHRWLLAGKGLSLACLQALPAWWPLRMSAPLVCMCVCQHATSSTTSDAGTKQSVHTRPVVNVCTQPCIRTYRDLTVNRAHTRTHARPCQAARTCMAHT